MKWRRSPTVAQGSSSTCAAGARARAAGGDSADATGPAAPPWPAGASLEDAWERGAGPEGEAGAPGRQLQGPGRQDARKGTDGGSRGTCGRIGRRGLARHRGGGLAAGSWLTQGRRPLGLRGLF